MQRPTRILISIAAGLALAATAAAVHAANPPPVNSSGMIHGCYTNKATNGTHVFMLQDLTTTCPSGTTASQWNEQAPMGDTKTTGAAGPQGPPSPAGPQGPPSPAGPQGPAGVSGYEVNWQDFSVGYNSIPVQEFDVFCSSGKVATGGGYRWFGNATDVVGSNPYGIGSGWWAESGWLVSLTHDPLEPVSRLEVFAVCVQVQ